MILTANSIQYTVKQLFTVAFPGQKFAVTIENAYLKIILEDSISLSMPFLSEMEIEDLLCGKLTANHIPTFDGKYQIPAFSPQEQDVEKATIDIPYDFVTPSFILLSRYEERISDVRDQFGRSLFKESISCHYNFIDLPLVDEYAMILRGKVLSVNHSFPITKRKGVVIPTHDIDHLCRFPNFFVAAKSILGGDLIKNHSLRMAWKSFKHYCHSFNNKMKDPMILAIEQLAAHDKESGLCSEFYFKGLIPNEKDFTYDINSSESVQCIHEIQRCGMKVGMHGGFYAYNNVETFQCERDRIQAIIGKPIECGRQHYLRFDAKETLKVWKSCGVKNDSTLGYAEREGFRCGTSHPYNLYDIDNDCVTEIIEHPLIVMDGTMYQYRKLSKEESLQKIMQLYQRCMVVEGDFVILWHNSTVFREFEPWFNEVYLVFLYQIKKESEFNRKD